MTTRKSAINNQGFPGYTLVCPGARSCCSRKVSADAPTVSARRELDRGRHRLASLGREDGAILTLFRKGRIAEAALDRRLDQIQAEERQLTARLLPPTAQVRDPEAIIARANAAKALLREMQRRITGEMTWEQKRELSELLVQSIRVETTDASGKPGAEVHVTYRFDAPITNIGAHRPTACAGCMSARPQHQAWDAYGSAHSLHRLAKA